MARLALLAALGLVCLLAPAAAGENRPDVAGVQRAYDEARPDAPGTHLDGLKILGVECRPAPAGRVSCEVGFSLAGEAEDRVYLDVASLERVAGGWRLVSGLCRRRN